MITATRTKVVIVGGGSAGITVAAQLVRKLRNAEITIVDPASKHYYQPLWMLVGAGVYPKEVTQRDEASVVPPGTTWLQDAVLEFDPDHNVVKTRGGHSLAYDWLVVAAGIQIDWDRIPGLRESLGRDGVCSNYDYQTVDKTWEFIRNFRGGNAIFTMPATPVKCGGAPQKIMYLADDAFRRQGVRDQSRVIFASAGKAIFAVAKYRPVLEQVVARKGIETLFHHDLKEIRPQPREAVFENIDSHEPVVLHYDLLHVTPPMSAPEFIRPARWPPRPVGSRPTNTRCSTPASPTSSPSATPLACRHRRPGPPSASRPLFW